jgi:hypothetical protein
MDYCLFLWQLIGLLQKGYKENAFFVFNNIHHTRIYHKGRIQPRLVIVYFFAYARVLYWSSPCGICGGFSGTETGFSPNTWGIFCQLSFQQRYMSINTRRVQKKRPNICYKDFILQHFKHCPLQRSPLYSRYTVPSVSSIIGMLRGTHFL